MNDRTRTPTASQSLVVRMAERYSVPERQFLSTLRDTCFRQTGRDAQPVSDAQMMALLVVADQYVLNPFLREIYAFPDKQRGIVPIVSIDGWLKIMNNHEQFDGVEFREAPLDQWIELPHARPCPPWMESVIYRKDRDHPMVTREYLDECYREPFARQGEPVKLGPWQTHTKRFLRHRATIQGARMAFGFAGIYDPEEAAGIIEGTVIRKDGGDVAADLNASVAGRANEKPDAEAPALQHADPAQARAEAEPTEPPSAAPAERAEAPAAEPDQFALEGQSEADLEEADEADPVPALAEVLERLAAVQTAEEYDLAADWARDLSEADREAPELREAMDAAEARIDPDAKPSRRSKRS